MPPEYPTVLDLIGGTPMVRLQRVARDVEPTVVAKLEYMNPGGSVKDRIGLRMIEAAEREGRLRPGGTIVEPTSGNTGVGLAMVAALRGYRMIFVMPDKMSQEKISLLRAFGAEVIVCPTAVDADSPESYYSVSDRLAEEIPGAFKPNQYANAANPQAHYDTTGPEIWEQTGGRITHFVSAMGTTGTITGVSRFLKEKNPKVKIIGAQPKEGSRIPGIRKWPQEYLPKIYDPSFVDELVYVSQPDAEEMCRRMAREEGIFAGISAAGALWVANEIAQREEKATIVFIVCDRGDRYLSTGVFPA
jgi:cysteine synthase B